MSQKVLSYDLGGTKVAVGVVSSTGHVIDQVREPVPFEKGKAAVLRQLVDLGLSFIRQHRGIKKVGIASAGPLDPIHGILLDPTHFVGPEGSWGRVPLGAVLEKKLKLPVVLENDAAAAILAEHWIGAAKRTQNAMVLTLGTGLGAGIFVNGALVRGGQHFHPEAGHIIINHRDLSAPCGCGNLGCAEAYLSGRNFARRARIRFPKGDLTAEQIAELARGKDPRALAAFEEYAQMMAVALYNYVRLYYPEVIIFTGSFAAASDLFLAATRKELTVLLKPIRKGLPFLPKLVVSNLHNQAGLIGGAYVALKQSSRKRSKSLTG